MVDSEYWKLTADLFSKLIEKPKMAEKLLKKPPPKYVFDIIINTMKKTGFPEGLYNDTELDVKHFEAVRIFRFFRIKIIVWNFSKKLLILLKLFLKKVLMSKQKTFVS